MALSKSTMIALNNDIIPLERNAKLIRRISYIMNTVLGNACYSDKELDNQINKGERLGNLNDEEIKMLRNGWKLRTNLANSLITELEITLKRYNKEF